MFGEKIHRFIYLFGILGLAFGMMIGTVPTSVPQIILMANWLLEKDFQKKWNLIKRNKVFWILGSVFIIHVLGLLYTLNIPAGIDDVRTKLPLFFLPLVLFTSRPLSGHEFRATLYCFIAGSLVNTVWCLIYSFVLHHHEQVRNASRFMSHIRLGLYLNVCISACVYFGMRFKGWKRSGLFLLGAYFTAVLFLLGLASGIANFIILACLGFCYVLLKQRPMVKIVASILFIGLVILLFVFISRVHQQQVSVNPGIQNIPQKYTPSHRLYFHSDSTGQKENGNYVLMNIQLEEIQMCWNREHLTDTFHYKPGHNLQRYEVLVRYMASKGLNKDSAGYLQLTGEDKANIGMNITNYQYPQWSFLRKRTYELVNEYSEFANGRNVNGHSLTMRIYFWKAAAFLVRERPLLGVGTGDVQDELNRAYGATNSPLEKEWHKRPHNQFLTITVALGFTGLLVFICSIVYPLLVYGRRLHFLFWPFFVLVTISFLIEDTLETQAGLTFYAFFNSIFAARAYVLKTGSVEV